MAFFAGDTQAVLQFEFELSIARGKFSDKQCGVLVCDSLQGVYMAKRNGQPGVNPCRSRPRETPCTLRLAKAPTESATMD